MYTERTNYYAKAGRLDDVLRIRRRASRIRVDLGLQAGTIRRKVESGKDGPDVQWECHFLTAEEHQSDLDARAASSEFDAIRAEMLLVTDRFERHVLETDSPAESGPWTGDVSLDGVPIAPEEIAFESAGLTLKGYLFVPPGQGPFPCMVANHGSTIHQGTSDICRPELAATFMSWGIASFHPHRRGYGNSPGPAWRDEVPGEFGSDEYDRQLVGRLDRESDDVVAALNHISGLAQIDADHVGVMGCSFGGINTLLAASKSERFRCAVEFAGGAMNWEHTHRLRDLMQDAALKLSQPIFFIQASNDYSIGPTRDLAAALAGTDKIVESRIYPAFGLTKDEGHLFERNGTMIWGSDVRRFLEKWL